jgi:hypothetical protein
VGEAGILGRRRGSKTLAEDLVWGMGWGRLDLSVCVIFSGFCVGLFLGTEEEARQ